MSTKGWPRHGDSMEPGVGAQCITPFLEGEIEGDR